MENQLVLDYVMQPMSSSSSSSGDEWENMSSSSSDENEGEADHDAIFPLFELLLRGRRKVRVHNFLATAHGYDDEQFRSHFRLRRITAYRLIDDLQASGSIPHHPDGMAKISSELSFLLTLWYLSNTEPLRTIADRFDISISSSFRVIRRVVDWLNSIINDQIKWPRGNRIAAVEQGFEDLRGIRGCIGAIDGTHIAIKKPLENAMDYCNRKKFFSIILQGIVDNNMRFTNVVCGEPGSLHDARVLRRSEVFRFAEEEVEELFPGDKFIIGDSAYPSLQWLVPPFKDNGALSPQHLEFNFLHSSTRMVVEKAFGLLKGRFRRLKYLEISNIQMMTKIVLSCCVLHNICLEEGEDEDFMIDEEDAGMNIEGHADGHAEGINPLQVDRRMNLFRQMFPQ
ncbi:protein ANTAGONIST OF LIKE HETEROCHROMATIN PROTEIN 1-like [Ischnura elegans]|uniref:protein ANTAGONIST OF LIKE HETEROCHROMATIN PROTEIN 1-like n=1 Tax=Ischnura elegans TaxID=197161 RepID=UPI001ED8AE6F|nr:protein ANTAGONIST OF LIKE HETEROCHROMATIN PROTEIN 1-like [Ischnura elegans]